MDEGSHDRLSELFERAVELPPHARAHFLEICTDDPAIRTELRSLLAVYNRSPNPLERLAGEVLPAALEAVEENEIAMRATPETATPRFIWAPTRSVKQEDTAEPSLCDTLTRTAQPGNDSAHPETRVSLTLGQRFGHYRIIRVLGAGGMGEVYEAEDEENGRHVAFKTVRNLSLGARDRARFLQEGRLAASISHPNVVYVFGTEEIEGIPVIATEIAVGGTLRDRVMAGGPLMPGQAVDVTCQLIAGLEAAANVGVLHRDVKPSNCFIDADGRVKIGDFGLAISTSKHERADLTLPGTVLGTPAYASPEQMRGQPLDVRSDIYSVGATLHWLLSGRAPFGDLHDGTARTRGDPDVITRLGEARGVVPGGLEKVVLQCLETGPRERPQSYAELRSLLQPYRSTSSSPATLGLRALAALVDLLLLDIFLGRLRILLLIRIDIPASRLELLGWLLAVAGLSIPFYGFSEGLWSASPGKRLLGLRVISANAQPITLSQSFARAALWWAFWTVPSLLVMTLVSPELLELRSLTSPSNAIYGALGAAVSFVGWGLLFVTARRRNGFAGLHDLATRTRVVSTFATEQSMTTRRPVRTSAVSPGAGRIGPYIVVEGSFGPGGTTVGFDERLARHVWIRRRSPGTPPTTPERRDVGRPTRLRWLNGRRNEDSNWDAFEAVEGEPLLAARAHPQHWATVRCWLLDLAEEIAAMSADKTEVSLSAKAVWVDGKRARLLDWAATAVSVDKGLSAKTPATAPDGWRRFLCDVAAIGLNIDWQGSQTFAGFADLPLHAREFIDELGAARLRTPDEAADRLRAYARLPGTLTRTRRGLHLAVSGALPAIALSVALTLAPFAILLRTRTADFFELQACLSRLEQLDRAEPTPETVRERTAIEIYVAGRFRGTFVGDPAGRKPWFFPFVKQRQTVFQQAIERHPTPSLEDVRHAAEETISLRAAARAAGQPDFASFIRMTPVMVLSLMMIVATFGLLSAWLAKGGVMMHGLGLAIVGPDGREASRGRAFARALIAWSPVFAGFALMERQLALGSVAQPPTVALPIVVIVLFIAGAIAAFWHPPSGPQDRLARTHVVLR